MGSGRRGRPGGGGGVADPVARALKELQENQAVRRARVYDLVELDELRAIKHLAFRLFGARGLVEFDCDRRTNQRRGPIQVGYFIDPPDPTGPNPRRRRRLLFQGNSIAELEEQVRLWRSRGGEA